MASSKAHGLDTEFPPYVLREYALLADGERGVLVGPRGDFAWMCAPAWHSDAIFSNLIGGAGLYAVAPTDNRFVWGGYYEEGSLIWHDRWVTTSGVIECREALAFPGDPHTAVLLRRVMAQEGTARVRVVLEARAEFGRQSMGNVAKHDDVWTARSGSLHLRLAGAPGARRSRGGALVAELEIPEGACCDLVLEISDQAPCENPVDAPTAWEGTEASWAQAVPAFDASVGPRDARQAYAVLRGLTSSGGGMVAAATMSLPERAEAGRNYDYRYAWVRDQSYAGQAVAAAGAHHLLDDAVSFISERLLADGPHLKPAYRIDGGPVPDERSLSQLVGYPGGADKVGNWVNKQFQLDGFGEVLLLFAAAGRHDHLDNAHWPAVEGAVAAIEDRWNEPDAGVWEIDNQHWAHSRLTCVAGLKAIVAQAPASQGGSWSALADTILADVARDCVHPSGRWQRSPGDDRVDAALLLPTIRGAISVEDPRSQATSAAIEDELVQDGYLYRFRQDSRPLAQAEGAFLLCGFVMALAHHQQGRTAQALAWFERHRAACGSAGLFSEEFDVVQRQLRGNIPQAFVHALLLECAVRLSEPWTD